MKQITFSLLCILLLISSTMYAQFPMSKGSTKIATTMAIIENLYVDKLDEEKLAEDAVKAILEKLDPHSTYISASEASDATDPLEGNFDGIGISFNMITDTVYVIEALAGGPSEKVGLRPGDKIIMVNDTLIAGVKMATKDVMLHLKGKKGTKVNLKVLRRGFEQLIDFRITRDKIPINSLDAAYMVDSKVGYIRLSRFSATTDTEFNKALKKLKSEGMQDLILDLEYNGGGYMSAAIEMADEFLGKDKLIVYTEGSRYPKKAEKATEKGLFKKGKLVVLINEISASASEIVAGAVQDWDRGVLVGRRSFGKGLVQRQFPFRDNSLMRLTVARYYTPTGRSIQRPYETGERKAYEQDFISRYNSGEMISADSIHFPDSLKFETLQNQRIVYGNGGIMPDYYVPIDTAAYPMYYRVVRAIGLTFKLAYDEVDTQRDALLKAYPTANSFLANYQISDETLLKIVSLAEEENIFLVDQKTPTLVEEKKEKINTATVPTGEKGKQEKKKYEYLKAEYDVAKPLLMNEIKALVARDLYNTETQLKILNQKNEIYLKGYEIIKDNKLYNSLLGKR